MSQSNLLQQLCNQALMGVKISFENQPGYGIKITAKKLVSSKQEYVSFSSVVKDDHITDEYIIDCISFTVEKLK